MGYGLKTFLSFVYPSAVWRMPNKKKKIYLTFDDGPIPNVTPWVLALLKQYNANATFFCIGENATKHPEILNEIIASGHSIGNHTYHHLNGWRTSTKEYLQNIEQCKQVLPPTKLFRPPYGRMRFSQYSNLKPHLSLIMWDVLSKDYDPNISPEQCLQRILSKTKAGSIVVFHDSLKAKRNLYYALPKMLEHFSKEGYGFEKLF